MYQERNSCCLEILFKNVNTNVDFLLTRFTIQKGREGCTDPGLRWVRRLMQIINKLHRHRVKTKTRPVPETLRPDPAKDPHNHETEVRPAPETTSPDPTTVSDGRET